MTWPERARRLIAPSLLDPVPRDHRQPDSQFRRRRVVAAATLVVGTVLLGLSLATDPGDPAFYYLTGAVAVVWLVGGFASGPLHLGFIRERNALRRPVVTPIAIGVITAGVFVVGAFVVREIDPIRDVIRTVLAHANQGNLALIAVVTVLNGVAEEVFFRGALYAALGRRHPLVITTIVYALVTIATGNPTLVFAAILMGTVFALQRRASGGILASMLTHVTWSVIMLFALPPIIGT